MSLCGHILGYNECGVRALASFVGQYVLVLLSEGGRGRGNHELADDLLDRGEGGAFR